MTLFFTSDEHYDSESIIHFCNRPFPNKMEMVSSLIHRNNEVVKPGDTVYHIGDFTFSEDVDPAFISSILRSLHGTHILVLGNHDYLNPLRLVNLGFRSVHTSLELKISGYDIVLCHDPSAWTVVPEGVIFLCGHIHKLFGTLPNEWVVNVGVDRRNYYPISFEDILKDLGLAKIKFPTRPFIG